MRYLRDAPPALYSILCATGWAQDTPPANGAEQDPSAVPDTATENTTKLPLEIADYLSFRRLPAHDTIRREFTREVLRTTEAQLEIYWIDQRATHGLTPPAVVREPSAAKALVAARPGAIAYIPATAVDHTVKLIRVEP